MSMILASFEKLFKSVMEKPEKISVYFAAVVHASVYTASWASAWAWKSNALMFVKANGFERS